MSTKLTNVFLDRVQRSGLITADDLESLRGEFEQDGVDFQDPKQIAQALVDKEVLTQWQVDKLLQGKHKGFFLGSYRLLRPLGKGGMGAVFLARHDLMRRRCAIKVLPTAQIKKGSSVLKRFYVEAQAVAAMDHQNIVRAYDVAMESKDNKEIHYLVMEYVEGQDMQAHVQDKGVLDYVHMADYVRQTANGLAHAHENGLVHRDIKPANLLVDQKGVLKILDLGLARFFDDGEAASLTAAHNETVLGTADYLSPEQALNSHNVDHRTDIYSLGCTAYFMLTGHPPFPDGSVAQRLVAHQVKMPEPLTKDRPDAPAELVAIVERMMAKNPDERFQSSEDLSATLAAWLVEYGGEDWRRQHSEISGDRTLLNLLSRKEPTRAMASPMSETELELAPIDEEEGPSTQSQAGPKRDASTRPMADDLALADLDDDEPSAEPDKPRSNVAAHPSAPRAGLAEQLPALESNVDLEELADLEEVSTSGSGSHDELFGELPIGDSIATLDASGAESGVDEVADDPLGAIDSDIQGMAVRTPSSSASHRRLQAADKKQTARAASKQFNVPIIIAIAGGALAVLILLMLIIFGGPDDTTQEFGSGGTVTPPQIPAPEPSPGNGGSKTTRPPETPANDVAGKPAVGEPKQQTPPGKQIAQASSNDPSRSPDVPSNSSDATSQGKPKPDEPKNADSDPVEKTTPAGQPKQEPVAKPQTQPKPAEVRDPPAKPADPPEAKPAVVKDPQELLAKVETFTVQFNSGGAKPDKKTAPVLTALGPAIGQKLQDSTDRLRVKLVEGDASSVMEIKLVIAQEGGYFVPKLSSKLDCKTDGDQTQTVWTHASELTKYTQQSNPRAVYGLWQNDLSDFFRQFERDMRDAREAHP